MPRGRARVAVVIEDDLDAQKLLEATLTDAGFAFHTTSSGLAGIELVRTLQPILTTLDLGLPGIDGFEVARQIRAFRSTYIMVVTVRSEQIDTLMALDAGADDYLTKPLRPREFRARIEAMMRRRPVRAWCLGSTWRSPNTYRKGGVRRGTATSSSTRPGTTSVDRPRATRDFL